MRTMLLVVCLLGCESPPVYTPVTAPIEPGPGVPEPSPPNEAARDSCDLEACAGVDAAEPDPPEPGPRAAKLLETEIHALEALFATTPRADHDRPKLMLRLAMAYEELAASDAGDAPKVDASHRASLRHYESLLAEYPAWCGAPSRWCADENGYRAGLVHARLGEHEAACKKLSAVVAADGSAFRGRACDAMRTIASGF